VMKQFRMLPGHGSLIKPYYYVCRTNDTYLAEHLGWHNYVEPDMNQLKKKVLCFAKYAGYVDPIILDQVRNGVKYFYKIFGRVYKAYWSFGVVWHWMRYIMARFPRNLNEIQSKLR